MEFNKNKDIIVSIIIPTFNHAIFLKKSIQSVIDQTYTNWELIIVDNYSTDETESIVNTFDDERIKYLKFKNNGVIAASRNKGVDIAKGIWIAFLDSDDFWKIDKLKTCFNLIDINTEILYHDVELIGKPVYFFRKHFVLKSRKLKPPFIKDLLINGNIICNSSLVVKKKLLDEINRIDEDANMIAAEDYNMLLKFATRTSNFQYIPKSLSFYRIHENGISNKNMSVPIQYASKDFILYLNQVELIQYNARINYVKASYYFKNHNVNFTLKYLYKSLSNGTFLIKFKSLWLLVKSFRIKFFK